VAVAEEIAWLKHAYAPDHLWIADDIFGLKPGWIEQFASCAVERGALVPFKCLLRADNVTDRVADALAAARCRTAWIGAESGSQRILDAMEKGTRVEQIDAATRRLRARGIEVGFFLQFGYPGETLDDIALTREMVRRCRPDDIGISVSYPLPGTRFYEQVKAQLGAKQNWVDSNDLAMMYRATYVPEFYRALHQLVHAEFRALRGSRYAGARPPTWRDVASGVLAAVRLPRYRRSMERLARQPLDVPATRVLAVLTPQAAAVPSEHS
jgi:anaerobic magnesium-protoporphyrin IX monomethyl ester cyclase